LKAGADAAGAAALRLFCLPYAGGGPRLFEGWAEALAPGVRVEALTLPGRGRLARQAPIDDYPRLVRWIADEVARRLAEGPPRRFAFFGHSAGARFAFGASLVLGERHGLAPAHCVLAANAPPALGRDRPRRSALADDALLAAAASMGGIPAEVLADASLMRMALPLLRSDLKANEEAACDAGRTLHCPFTLVAWDGDVELKVESVWAWRACTTGPVRTVLLSGDHFSVQRTPRPLLALLRSALVDGPL
jgi:surfactin synthase thioesterase subunit